MDQYVVSVVNLEVFSVFIGCSSYPICILLFKEGDDVLITLIAKTTLIQTFKLQKYISKVFWLTVMMVIAHFRHSGWVTMQKTTEDKASGK